MLVLSSLLALAAPTAIEAATVTSVVSGNWNNGATWSTGAPPNAADSITICHDVALTGACTVGATGALVVLANSELAGGFAVTTAAGSRIAVTGTLAIESVNHSGAITVESGGSLRTTKHLDLTATATIESYGSVVIGDGSTNNGSITVQDGTFHIQKEMDSANGSFTMYAGTVTLDGTYTVGTFILDGGSVTMNGDFISNMGSDFQVLEGSAHVYGKFDIDQGGLTSTGVGLINICTGGEMIVEDPVVSGTVNFCTDCGGNCVDCDLLTEDCNAPLPIQLTQFAATQAEDGVEVQWATAAEINNDYFIVERSSNGIDYEVLDYVPGQGTSAVATRYTTLDASPQPGWNYYRLTQIDINGLSKQFESIALLVQEWGAGHELNLQVFPNPAVGTHFSVAFLGDGVPATVSLVNLAGKRLWTGQVQTAAGQSTLWRPTQPLAAGMYLLEVVCSQRCERASIIVD